VAAALLAVPAGPVRAAEWEVAQAEGTVAPATAPTRAPSEKVEEITVTARKMEEGLQETPVAVSAFRSEDLQEQGVRSLEDISALVPNLTMKEGTYGQANITLRGVGQRDVASFLDPAVGVYLDGVYMARAFGPLVSTVDVERIEVLRGPQGTLYGKNSVGGAVNFITKKPGPELETYGEVRWGSFGTLDARVSANVPLVDEKLFTRWSFASEHNDGWAKNQVTGSQWSDKSLLSASGQIRALVTDSVTWDLHGSWMKQHQKPPAVECEITYPNLAVLGPLRAFGIDFATSLLVLPGIGADPSIQSFAQECDQSRADGPEYFRSNLPGRFEIDGSGLTNVVTWDLDEDLTLKSLTSAQRQQVRYVSDFDGTSTRLAQEFHLHPPLQQRQYMQELQLSGRLLDGRGSFTSGVFLFWESTRDGKGDRDFVAGLNRMTLEDENHVASRAGYGQVTYDVNDWLQLTGGLRYSWERKQVEITRYVMPGALGAPSPNPRYEKLTDNWSKWTPLASVKLTASDDLAARLGLDSAMTYLTYSVGFKSGGINGRGFEGPFEQETLYSYELGTKLVAFDNRLTVNSALFISVYRDMQITTSQADVDTNQPNGVVRNAGKAQIRGAEIEVLAMPLPGLVLQGSLGITDSWFEEFDDQMVTGYVGFTTPIFSPIDRSNEPLTDTPDFQLNLSAQYTFDLSAFGSSHAGFLTPRVGVTITDDAYHHLRPEGLSAAGDPFEQNKYAIWTGRLTWSSSDDRMHVAAYVHNWGNRRYFDGATDFSDNLAMGTKFYGPPRMYGIEIGYRFD
jgi:iron complex outermembrane receptor protein